MLTTYLVKNELGIEGGWRLGKKVLPLLNVGIRAEVLAVEERQTGESFKEF